MRRKLTAAFCLMAALCTLSCKKDGKGPLPQMEMELSAVTSTGVSVAVKLSEGASAYRMKVVPLDAFDSKAVSAELEDGAGYTAEKRRIERLHGCKDFVVAARPYSSDGSLGELVSERFSLGEMALDIQLYTPGDSLGVELNRYNTLKVIATSNGIAAKGRCAMAVSDIWVPLMVEKGLKAAAEAVFASNRIDLTIQQLEEMADQNPLKRDLMYFNDLSDGTEYTLVVCLEDLDGESHYYSFKGATKRLNP